MKRVPAILALATVFIFQVWVATNMFLPMGCVAPRIVHGKILNAVYNFQWIWTCNHYHWGLFVGVIVVMLLVDAVVILIANRRIEHGGRT